MKITMYAVIKHCCYLTLSRLKNKPSAQAAGADPTDGTPPILLK